VNRLDKVLDKKMSVIANLREKLNDFRGKLQVRLCCTPRTFSQAFTMHHVQLYMVE
jgi:hypothetical protein